MGFLPTLELKNNYLKFKTLYINNFILLTYSEMFMQYLWFGKVYSPFILKASHHRMRSGIFKT